ncbi:AraC family transcriptional regulator [Stutzerimonas stutzeri]|jgi:AraC-like DNA-binding protein|nr:AraC family transcriptional regulator [Stutzerimonas stutzeri]HAG17844.1 AraC family transcriptional regulator [Pseudomonas sp.]RRV31108.1 AraC family transcriptional regulator [Stutzerimonas stutzeri]RRV66869.1 AraC family transcriptional regulator [Stutzerimonas stutzeri]RRW17352.1 AraC family transcriptional regulator [Stutzerimonas stutzeri]
MYGNRIVLVRNTMMSPNIEALSKVQFAECSMVSACDAEYPRHTHEEYVVSANLAGCEKIWYDGRSGEVLSNQVTIYNPMTVQSSRFCSAGSRFISVHLDAERVRTAFRENGGALHGPLFDEGVFNDLALFKAIFALHFANLPGQREEALYGMLGELFRFGGKGSDEADPDKIARLVEYMQDSLYDEVDLDDMSAVTGLSKFHLVRSFKAAKSLPPMQFMKQLRLIEARKRFRRGDAAARVATELYFYDQGHMSNSFRRVMGISPVRYASMVGDARRHHEFKVSSNHNV